MERVNDLRGRAEAERGRAEVNLKDGTLVILFQNKVGIDTIDDTGIIRSHPNQYGNMKTYTYSDFLAMYTRSKELN